MSTFFKYLIIICCIIILCSCEKEEGFGGSSEIMGKLIKKVYNDDYSLLLEEVPAKDEDVFLVFGNQQVVGDKVETSFTGEFAFSYLFEGAYTLYYYSQDFENTSSKKIEMVHPIELKKGKSKDMGNLVIYDTYQFDEGYAKISGKVWLKNYHNESSWPNLIVKDITPAQELEVYLVYGGHKQYDERIRTNYDGTFTFNNLIIGKYKVYVYSEDIKGGTADIVVSQEIEITEKEQEIQLGEMTIEKL